MPIGNQELDRLLVKIERKDKEALAALYNHTKSAVYGFALSILRNRAEAEDVMQEAFINIYKAAKGYQSRGKPLAWILTIVRNLSLMRLREMKKYEPNPDWLQEAVNPEDSTSRSLNRLLLDTALKVLGAEERQIVILYSVAGLKHREIAALLNLPLSTVLSKYRRSLSKLKKQMEEENFND